MSINFSTQLRKLYKKEKAFQESTRVVDISTKKNFEKIFDSHGDMT